MHAMERAYGLMAQDSGYYYADVITNDNARADLINYQYMINEICKLLLQLGECPSSLEALKSFVLRKNKFYTNLNKLNYYRCKLLSKITLGKTRKHYKEKRYRLKSFVRK